MNKLAHATTFKSADLEILGTELVSEVTTIRVSSCTKKQFTDASKVLSLSQWPNSLCFVQFIQVIMLVISSWLFAISSADLK